MTYDLADKLTGIDAAGTANDATFTFDALGRFRTRVLSGSTDTYSYAGTSETVERISNSSGPTVTDSIVSPAGDRLGIRQGSTVNWLLPDPHGSVGAALDATEATVVHAIRYDAYGQTIGTGSAGGTAVGAANWKYQGRLDISPAGLATPLYDMSARYYSPGLGTFSQLDSVMGSAQNPLSMNRFLYALANPATFIDPSGHTACRFGGEDCKSLATHTDSVRAAKNDRARKTAVGRRLAADEFVKRDHRTMRQIKEAGARVAAAKASREYDDHEANRNATLGGEIPHTAAACQGICIDPMAAVAGVGIAVGGIALCVALCAPAGLAVAGAIATTALVGAGVGAGVGAASYAAGTAINNFQSGKGLSLEGVTAEGALLSAATGAVIGGTAGVISGGLGLAVFGTAKVTAFSLEGLALAEVAGPLGTVAGFGFKGLTGQKLGPADAVSMVFNSLPVPGSYGTQIGWGTLLDQVVNQLTGG